MSLKHWFRILGLHHLQYLKGYSINCGSKARLDMVASCFWVCVQNTVKLVVHMLLSNCACVTGTELPESPLPTLSAHVWTCTSVYTHQFTASMGGPVGNQGRKQWSCLTAMLLSFCVLNSSLPIFLSYCGMVPPFLFLWNERDPSLFSTY